MQERRHRGMLSPGTAILGVLTRVMNGNDRMPRAGLDERCTMHFGSQSSTHLLQCQKMLSMSRKTFDRGESHFIC